ncbi:MAG: hypothetical protein RLZZ245_42 [Verrucomicrobiota bacterium]
MEKLRGIHILERGEHFLSVWKHQAPEQERFAGIDCQELEADVGAAQQAHERVRDAEILLRGLRLERDQADQKLASKLLRIACGCGPNPPAAQLRFYAEKSSASRRGRAWPSILGQSAGVVG